MSRAEAEQRFAAEEAARIKSLYGDELASIAELQNAERLLAVANAALADAKAALMRATVDLERTVFRAPFNGRVRGEERRRRAVCRERIDDSDALRHRSSSGSPPLG